MRKEWEIYIKRAKKYDAPEKKGAKEEKWRKILQPFGLFEIGDG